MQGYKVTVISTGESATFTTKEQANQHARRLINELDKSINVRKVEIAE